MLANGALLAYSLPHVVKEREQSRGIFNQSVWQSGYTGGEESVLGQQMGTIIYLYQSEKAIK